MRQGGRVSFPHPVIGNADDAAGRFSPTLKRSNDRQTLRLDVHDLDTENEAVANYIASGRASYALRVECGSTGYRETFLSTETTLSCVIPITSLYEEVEVEAGVIARRDMPDYRPSNPHPDYGPAVFSVEPGDVLAVAPGWRFAIDHDWDPLKAPLPSIMRIVCTDEDSGPFDAVLDTPKIRVRVSKPDFKAYLARKNDSAEVLHASLVFPVLVHAIAKMEEEDFKECLWAVRLRELMSSMELDQGKPLVAAQELLEFPFARGLKRIEQLLTEVDDD